MFINFGKCKCLHTGYGKENVQRTMGTKYYRKRKDLGSTIGADMKVSEQCGIASKGNQMIGLSMRNIVYKEKSTNNIAVQNNS